MPALEAIQLATKYIYTWASRGYCLPHCATNGCCHANVFWAICNIWIRPIDLVLWRFGDVLPDWNSPARRECWRWARDSDTCLGVPTRGSSICFRSMTSGRPALPFSTAGSLAAFRWPLLYRVHDFLPFGVGDDLSPIRRASGDRTRSRSYAAPAGAPEGRAVPAPPAARRRVPAAGGLPAA
jgi:hypothetical protein